MACAAVLISIMFRTTLSRTILNKNYKCHNPQCFTGSNTFIFGRIYPYPDYTDGRNTKVYLMYHKFEECYGKYISESAGKLECVAATVESDIRRFLLPELVEHIRGHLFNVLTTCEI